MPTYVYRCTNKRCSDVVEAEFPMGTAPRELDICLECVSGALVRVYLPSAVSFKGSGFYKTDHSKAKHVTTSTKVGVSGSHMYPTKDVGGTVKHQHEVYCNANKP